jgi:glycosyltransferase involved in cell wall biosynthesis
MSPERVLLVHNAYKQAGGEDAVVAAELKLLRRKGHEVIELRRDNHAIDHMNSADVALQTLWSNTTRSEALQLLRTHRPDVVHVHNTFPLVSPALYWACAAERVPVVQTLHNFRLACPQAMFLREGKICEQCLGKTPWPALTHGCYRDSRAKTAVVFGMITLHRTINTYADKVTRYIALNEFCKSKFVQAGLPRERIVVKPNFVETSGAEAETERSGFLFVGRLSSEKGIGVLRESWLGCRGLQLRVVGSGSEAASLEVQHGIEMLGQRAPAEVAAEMRRATALLVPSIWYENFPMVVVEAFAAGLPVIASRLGALAEIVEDGKTGLLFDPGDAQALARVMRWAHEHPAEMAAMGRHARARFESRYTAEINYSQLSGIYRSAINEETRFVLPPQAAHA